MVHQLPELGVSSSQAYVLQYVSSSGEVLSSFHSPYDISRTEVPNPENGSWRWFVRGTRVDFLSDAVKSFGFTERNLGGDKGLALAMGDLNTDSKTELLGFTSDADGATYVGYSNQGLGKLYVDRDFRDVRIADLNGDGIDDVVSNVYGNGCTLIGLNNTDGTYQWVTPLRSDGGCIGGHGETILVADFDDDGLLDIFLPSYERYDFLQNLGNGSFIEVGDSRGFSFIRQVNPEGAAAIDIDLDGDVDIVVGDDVFVQDGRGFFSPLAQPFGLSPLQDEGLSVFDLDGDGIFDVVKNHPSYGPRAFWGEKNGILFSDSGWLLGGEPVLTRSYGLAVGNLSNNRLADIVFAGGVHVAHLPIFVFMLLRGNSAACKIFCLHTWVIGKTY